MRHGQARRTAAADQDRAGLVAVCDDLRQEHVHGCSAGRNERLADERNLPRIALVWLRVRQPDVGDVLDEVADRLVVGRRVRHARDDGIRLEPLRLLVGCDRLLDVVALLCPEEPEVPADRIERIAKCNRIILLRSGSRSRSASSRRGVASCWRGSTPSIGRPDSRAGTRAGQQRRSADASLDEQRLPVNGHFGEPPSRPSGWFVATPGLTERCSCHSLTAVYVSRMRLSAPPRTLASSAPAPMMSAPVSKTL